jgi:activator of HSP90 ATPase
MAQTVHQTIILPARPDRLFDMYLDPKEHAAFTGAPVTIAARPGAAFSAFGDKLSGTILHVAPKKMIVQTWRSVNFPAEAIDSVLVLTFWPNEQGGRIELTQVNVCDEDFEGVNKGWPKFYWEPWKAHLLAHPGA